MYPAGISEVVSQLSKMLLSILAILRYRWVNINFNIVCNKIVNPLLSKMLTYSTSYFFHLAMVNLKRENAAMEDRKSGLKTLLRSCSSPSALTLSAGKMPVRIVRVGVQLFIRDPYAAKKTVLLRQQNAEKLEKHVQTLPMPVRTFLSNVLIA